MDLTNIEGLSEAQQNAIGEAVAAEIEGLKSKRDQLLAQEVQLKAKNHEFSAQLEDLKEFKEEYEARQEAGANDHKATLERAKARFDRDKAKLEEEGARLKAELESVVLDKGISDALDSINVLPKQKPILERYFRAEAKIEDGRGYIGEAEIMDAMKAWAEKDEAKSFIAAPRNSGGGAQGGSHQSGNGEVNPWNPQTRNLTEQGRIYKADKNKAIQMASQHGVTLP